MDLLTSKFRVCRTVAGRSIADAGDRLRGYARAIHPCAALLALIATMLVTVGCSTSGRGSSAGLAAASDLALEIIVRAGRDRGEHHAGAENRSGHFLLLPDGSLHVGSQGRGLPPRQRILTKDELATVRTLIARLDERFAAVPPVWSAGVLPEPGALRVVIDVREPESARMTIHSAAPGEAVDADVAGIVRYLAALSWTPDLEPARQQIAPRRYDPGPDPYGRYRRSADAARPE